MSTKKLSATKRLVLAMDRCAVARGEAQWTNGYRAAARRTDLDEADRLYAKEQRQWKLAETAETAFARVARNIIREERAKAKGARRS